MLCQGICDRFRAKKLGPSFYLDIKAKYCTGCCMFIKYENGNRCPCCHRILRVKPISKKKYFKRLEIIHDDNSEVLTQIRASHF